jgi:hypothetical protein
MVYLKSNSTDIHVHIHGLIPRPFDSLYPILFNLPEALCVHMNSRGAFQHDDARDTKLHLIVKLG